MRIFIMAAFGMLAACGSESSENNASDDMTADQEAKYDSLSSEGQDHVDKQMEAYDEHCASSSEC